MRNAIEDPHYHFISYVEDGLCIHSNPFLKLPARPPCNILFILSFVYYFLRAVTVAFDLLCTPHNFIFFAFVWHIFLWFTNSCFCDEENLGEGYDFALVSPLLSSWMPYSYFSESFFCQLTWILHAITKELHVSKSVAFNLHKVCM